MINKALFILRRGARMQRINFALSRGGATSALRVIDPKFPRTWEFSAFSQNGEDGIIDYLTRQLLDSNQYFVEIGASDGLENNSSWLAIARKFNGLMIEGDPKSSKNCEKFVSSLNLGVQSVCMFVAKENAPQLRRIAREASPDFMSLDIDGNDYYVCEALFDAGFRPKIFAVEYNSAFGPDRAVTIPYDPNFDFKRAHSSQIYYGVSIGAWKKFFSKRGYQFVTVDSNGVNAFFIDPGCFRKDFVEGISGTSFCENFYQMTKFRMPWNEQIQMIQGLPTVEVQN